MVCSGEMVFLSDLLQISFASEDSKWINSVQQFTTISLASFATLMLGRISLIILLMAALGIVKSSSLLPEDEAILLFFICYSLRFASKGLSQFRYGSAKSHEYTSLRKSDPQHCLIQ